MFLSKRQLFFLLSFSSLLLVQLVLGQTAYKYILLLFWSIFFILHLTKLQWSLLYNYKLPLLLWTIWIGFLLLSSIFTHNVPLTLDSVMHHLFAYCMLVFFLALDKNFISNKLLLFVIVVVGVVLTLLSSIATFVPGLGSIFPGMNVLYPSYGHSHLGAVLVLVIPLAWWFFFQYKKNTVVVVPLLLTLGLLTSFGRVAVFISCLQLLAIGFFVFKKKLLSFNKIGPVIFLCIALLLLAKLVLQTVFSLPEKFAVTAQCPLSRFERQLCKPLDTEYRWYYWQQALTGVAEYPLTGYGPGTFQLVNVKYRQLSAMKTLYAHNEYLNIFAETGVFGGLSFILALVGSLYIGWKNLGKIKSTLQNPQKYFVLLSLVSISSNNFFDYDWHFLGTYCLTMILLAIFLEKDTKKIHPQMLVSRVIQGIFCISIGSIFILSCLFLILNHKISKNHISGAFSLFPYYLQHYTHFIWSDQLTELQTKQLQKIYSYYPDWYAQQAQSLLSEEKEVLFTINPWSFIEQADFEQLPVEKVIELGVAIEQKLKTAEKKYGYKNWEQERVVTAELYKKAVQELKKNNKETGYALYTLAVRINPWGIHQTSLPIDLGTPTAEDCAFLTELATVPVTAFGEQSNHFAYGYQRCITLEFASMSFEQIVVLTNQATTLAPWVKEELVKDIYSFHKQDLEAVDNSPIQEKYKKLISLLEN